MCAGKCKMCETHCCPTGFLIHVLRRYVEFPKTFTYIIFTVCNPSEKYLEVSSSISERAILFMRDTRSRFFGLWLNGQLGMKFSFMAVGDVSPDLTDI